MSCIRVIDRMWSRISSGAATIVARRCCSETRRHLIAVLRVARGALGGYHAPVHVEPTPPPPFFRTDVHREECSADTPLRARFMRHNSVCKAGPSGLATKAASHEERESAATDPSPPPTTKPTHLSQEILR